jgi:aminoglycoside/choline kinase family phosphotransferase
MPDNEGLRHGIARYARELRSYGKYLNRVVTYPALAPTRPLLTANRELL